MEQDVKRLQFTDSVPVLMLPSSSKNLILPNVNIAEFVSIGMAEPVAEAPAWFIGMVSWRGQRVPLISFERLNGDSDAPAQSGQVAILNGISGREELPFFAIMCSGIPRQSRIVEEDLTVDTVAAASGHIELSRVLLAGEPGIIPDLEVIEAQICRVLLSL